MITRITIVQLYFFLLKVAVILIPGFQFGPKLGFTSSLSVMAFEVPI